MWGAAKGTVGGAIGWIMGSRQRRFYAALVLAVLVAVGPFALDSLNDARSGATPSALTFGWACLGLAFAAPAAAGVAGSRVVHRSADRRGRTARGSTIALVLTAGACSWAAAVWSDAVLWPAHDPSIGFDQWTAPHVWGGLGAAFWNMAVLLRAENPTGFSTYSAEFGKTIADGAVWMRMSNDALLDLWQAGVPAHAAAELTRQGHSPVQIIAAHRDGVPPALVSGAL